MTKILVYIIELYQRYLSPDTGWTRIFFRGGYCKYTPSCSEYSKHAIIKYGPLRGTVMGFWRILRCNPWSKGGHDPV
ncbi:MAG: membrane protein insertion efficiency factor YidD [Candidatus Berkelbacteria bacterium]